MKTTYTAWAAIGASLLMAACGGGGGEGATGTQNANPGRGELMQSPPPRITSLTADDFRTQLLASTDGQGALTLSTNSPTGVLPCGVDIQYIKYGTVGGAGEATNASGALMVPTGSDSKCTGARPIVLYAHGTNITKRYNIADVADKTNPAYKEAILLASLYAAQGYIVVAPNYAGYDSSSLSYHPYVNADQQSKDMIDALAAAKAALPNLIRPTVASSKLFLTGYSQGGYVAMATHKALQAAGVTVTAAADMSGPYSLAAYVDAVFLGNVAAGSTAFAPLLVNSYKNSYPAAGIYTATSDVYESTFASGIESLVPGAYDFTTVYSSGKLPQTALFSSTVIPGFASITPPVTGAATDALFALGFGATNLIKNSYRAAYVQDALANPDNALATSPTTYQPPAAPQNAVRKLLKQNDLRSFKPTAPVLLCGGAQDPTVFYSVNTSVMAGLWGAQGVTNFKLLDLEGGTSTMPGAATFQGLFASAKSATAAAAGSNPIAQATAVTLAYHGTLVPPYCNKAAKTFFDAN